MKAVKTVSFILFLTAAVMIVLDNTLIKASIMPYWLTVTVVAASVLLTGVIVQMAVKRIYFGRGGYRREEDED